MLVLCGYFLVLLSTSYAQSTWDYAGEEYWNVTDTTQCHGIRQSPININTSTVFDLYFWNRLVLTDYNKAIVGKLKNNGHTLVWTPDSLTGAPTVQMPLLTGTYSFEQLHFHWGSHDQQGSEHTINGRSFPMEVHLVHRNMRYSTLAEALAAPAKDGILVMGIFYQVSYQTDDSTTPITTIINADQVDDKNDEQACTLNLQDFLEDVGRSYFTYKGSLTTPGCNEVVDFVIFECTLQITEAHMDLFRTKVHYADGSPMTDNFRNVQWINNRFINRIFN